MLDFIKMQGTGNNYIYIDCMNKDLEQYNFSELAKKISDVNYGIGSDGLILICRSLFADAKMIMYNKDGSEGKMCGNGIRCVGKYLYGKYYKRKKLYIETKSGIKEINLIVENNEVTDIIVDMGKPILDPKMIPLNLDCELVLNKKIVYEEQELYINCISMGNPHTVIFVDDVDAINLEYIYKIVNRSNIFENECNVEIVQVLDKNKIKLRVFERGSGETLSCGTGACASVVAGVLNRLLDWDTEIQVILKGGILYIKYSDTVYLKGPAEIICKGKYLVKKY